MSFHTVLAPSILTSVPNLVMLLALALALALALLFALVLALALALVLALSWCGRAGGREDAFGTPWLPCPASGVSQTLSQALSHACHMPVTCLGPRAPVRAPPLSSPRPS